MSNVYEIQRFKNLKSFRFFIDLKKITIILKFQIFDHRSIKGWSDTICKNLLELYNNEKA